MSLRLAMAIGSLLLVCGFLAISLAQSFNQVLLVYGVLIAPANILIGPLAVTVLLSRWFIKRRGAAIGIAIAGIALGGLVFPPVIQFLFDTFGWRVGLRVLALIVLVLTIPATALIVNRPADRGLHPDGAAADVEAARTAGPQPAFSSWAILKDPNFWTIAVLVATVTAGLKGMITNLSPLAIDEGVSATSAAYLISIYAGMGFIAKLAFAAIADRLNPRHLMVFSLVGYAMGTGCLVFAEAGYWMIALGVSFMGFFGGMMIPLESFLIPRVFGRDVVGRVGGLMNLAILSFLLLSPPLFGRIYDVTGSYDAIFLVFTGLALVVLLVLVPRVRLHEYDTPAEPSPAAQPAE
jgi:MFS family permease